MRVEALTDAALRGFELAGLMELIAAVRCCIDTAVYLRRLIAAAEARRAARATGDACVADSLVCTTGLSRRYARRGTWRISRWRAWSARYVTPWFYDDVMDIKRCPTVFGLIDRHRCHTCCLGWSHAT